MAQRTREIGVRLAVGATSWAVALQFIGEAVVLSGLGGILGVGVSFIGAFVFEYTLKWPIAVPVSTLAVAVMSAGLVGLISGAYPAWRASRLDPITALRQE